jgi:predicted amino acid dehydrogenase
VLVVRRIDVTRLNFRGMSVAIVGGTGGIGRAISRFLAARGEQRGRAMGEGSCVCSS